MIAPQTEDGFTRIANELLEAILRFPFSKRELLVVMAIIRKTYGFNKKTDDMTGQQIANLTGVGRNHVNVCVNDLAARNIVLKRDGRFGQVLGINKNYSEWLLVPNRDAIVPNRDTSQNGTLASPNLGLLLVPKRDTQKTTPKDNSKRQRASVPKRDYPDGLNAQAWETYVTYRRESKFKTLKPASIEKQQLWLVAQGPPDVQAQIVDQTIRNSWQGLFELKGERHGAHQQDIRSRAERHHDKLREIAERSLAQEREKGAA